MNYIYLHLFKRLSPGREVCDKVTEARLYFMPEQSPSDFSSLQSFANSYFWINSRIMPFANAFLFLN